MDSKKSLRCLSALSASVCVVLLLPEWVSAHALEAIVQVTNTAVIIEAGYDDDTPAPSAKIVIRDANQRLVYEGTTDVRGLCTFPLPPGGRYVAEVTSTGHRARVEFVIVPSEYRSWRPNRRVGLILGVSGLLALTMASWWRLRRRQKPPSNSSPMAITQEGGLPLM